MNCNKRVTCRLLVIVYVSLIHGRTHFCINSHASSLNVAGIDVALTATMPAYTSANSPCVFHEDTHFPPNYSWGKPPRVSDFSTAHRLGTRLWLSLRGGLHRN